MPRGRRSDELSPRARFFRDKLAEECGARVKLERQKRIHDQNIADLLTRARDEGIATGQLASFVTILKPNGVETVSRQAVEQMIKAHGASNGAAPKESDGPSVDLSVFQ